MENTLGKYCILLETAECSSVVIAVLPYLSDTLQIHVCLCAVSVALGGCFCITVLFIHVPSETHPYFIVGLVGEVLSLLGLVSLLFIS